MKGVVKVCSSNLEYINCLIEIEDKYQLLKDSIHGFAYWVFHREELMVELLRRKNGYDATSQYETMTRMKKLKLRCNMIKNAVFHHGVPLKNIDVLVFNHERRVWNGAVYECIYTDEIVKYFSRAIVMERPYHQQHFRPVDTENLMYTDKIEVLATLYLIFYKHVYKNKYEQINAMIGAKVKKPCGELIRMLQVDYDTDQIVRRMTDGYFLYQMKKRLFDKELNRYRPNVVLEVVGDNVDCMILNELASIKEIPTIELQHGATGKEHIAYNYPKNERIVQFPKYFFAFSEYWCQEARYPIPKEQCIAVGFPYLEKTAQKFRKETNDSIKIILFISQKPVGKELSCIAVELNQKIDQSIYKIIYKLHPEEYNDWKYRYPQLAESGIEVIDSFDTNLYYLFSISFCQVGGYGSTAVFEGMYFGLQTFVYKYKAISFLMSLCEQGYAQDFDSTEQLLQMISGSAVIVKEAASFWTKNAIENMQIEIEAIMNGTK